MTRTRTCTIQTGEITLTLTKEEISNQTLHRIGSRYQHQYQFRPPPLPTSSSPILEVMMKQLIANQQKTDSDLQNIRNQIRQIQAMQSQMSQMAIAINCLKS